MILSRREAAIVAESWAGTPYARGGRVKGSQGGVDCGTLLAEYLVGIGACPREEMDQFIEDLGFLSNDWFCHAHAEKYMNALAKYAAKKWEGVCAGTPPALPGDIAMYRVVDSDRFNHGSIIVGWPYAVHAFDKRVVKTRPGLHSLTSHVPMALFDPFRKEAA
jgi:cell wall-associated NlpC family hydrolase